MMHPAFHQLVCKTSAIVVRSTHIFLSSFRCSQFSSQRPAIRRPTPWVDPSDSEDQQRKFLFREKTRQGSLRYRLCSTKYVRPWVIHSSLLGAPRFCFVSSTRSYQSCLSRPKKSRTSTWIDHFDPEWNPNGQTTRENVAAHCSHVWLRLRYELRSSIHCDGVGTIRSGEIPQRKASSQWPRKKSDLETTGAHRYCPASPRHCNILRLIIRSLIRLDWSSLGPSRYQTCQSARLFWQSNQTSRSGHCSESEHVQVESPPSPSLSSLFLVFRNAPNGTPGFSAPEVVLGPHVGGAINTSKSDVWSWGAVLCRIAYGAGPRCSQTPHGLQYHHPAYVPPPGTPPSRDPLMLDVLKHTLVPIDRRVDVSWLSNHPFTRTWIETLKRIFPFLWMKRTSVMKSLFSFFSLSLSRERCWTDKKTRRSIFLVIRISFDYSVKTTHDKDVEIIRLSH